jgi:cell fate (sporulation/competence/biofilm development) regulator YmcA (YheA/YmcA/DUF963 family)
LNSLQKLIESIKTDKNVARFKELEAIIDQDIKLKEDYKYLQHLQKLMVQKQAKKLDASKEEQDYEAQLDKVLSHVLMSEYLDLLEVVNNDLQMIQEIISSEIEHDFKE